MIHVHQDNRASRRLLGVRGRGRRSVEAVLEEERRAREIEQHCSLYSLLRRVHFHDRYKHRGILGRYLSIKT